MRSLLRLSCSRPASASVQIDLGLLIIRIIIGLALCTVFEKVLPRDGRWGPQDWFIADVREMGFPAPMFFAWCAVLSEFLGGILLVLGLFTRPAAFFNMVTLFVAAFVHHGGDVSGKGLNATLFFAITLGLTFTGAGRFSLDCFLGRKLAVTPAISDSTDARSPFDW